MDIRRVDLNLLLALDALLRCHNVSRAAEALGVSQPAMSFALAKLRAVFDDQLFVRTGRGIRPTPRAEELAQPLRRVLDIISNDLLRPASFDPATTRRTFALNMSDVGELVFLPRIRAYLQEAAPAATIRTLSLPPEQLDAALESGEVDLAVGYFDGLVAQGLYQQRLFSHSFACIVSKSHPSIRHGLSLQQFLDAQHLVVRQEGKRGPDLFEQALAAAGIERRVVLEVPHFLALPLLIADSALIATVPYAVAASFAQMAELQLLRPPVDVAPAHVKQYWHLRFHGDEANAWLRHMIAELFGEPQPEALGVD